MERDGYREKEKERQRGRERETERARDAVPLLPPVSQLGSVQLVLEKEAIICKPSSSVHTWTCFQHLSPRAVSVTNSNKHPKLITLLPLNSFCKEQKKSSPTEQLWDLFPLFFFFFLFLPFLHLCLIVTRHMCVHTQSCQKFGCGLQAF